MKLTAVTSVVDTFLPPGLLNPGLMKAVLPAVLLGLSACSSDGTAITADGGPACDSGEAVSASYCVEYISGAAMGETVGKNTLTLQVTRRSDGTPVSDLALTLSPLMTMVSGMQHATPHEPCTASKDIAGDYHCTVYYVMASSMGGTLMGEWRLQVDLAGESVTFTPDVGMAMGDTGLASLKGLLATDAIPGMPSPENRTYYLFPESLSGRNGEYTLRLFVAARESMLSFPAVSVGSLLNAGDGRHELRVDAMSVEASVDGVSWLPAQDDGNGHWRVTQLSGLSDGVRAEVRVRLRVNGEQKTGNGLGVDGTANDHASFMLTPGSL